ncbi:MAG: ATP-binding cassette domain-containing protein [Candidatus Krumholzibacteriia bacterium]
MAVDVVLADVSVSFDDTVALADASLAVAAGEHVALIGPSGAGKTTLLRLLNGSALPSRGTVTVGGARLADLAPRALRTLRSRVAVVHQDLRLVPNLRVSQNVLAGGLGRQGFWASVRTLVRPRRSELESVAELLVRVGIADRLFERVDRLSGGQQQRVAIARALFQHPDLLLADEPVASVDPARARDVVGLLVRLAREDGMTLVMSLHNLELAREFFPRVVGLRGGRVCWDGDPRDLAAADLDGLYRLSSGGADDGGT